MNTRTLCAALVAMSLFSSAARAREYVIWECQTTPVPNGPDYEVVIASAINNTIATFYEGSFDGKGNPNPYFYSERFRVQPNWPNFTAPYDSNSTLYINPLVGTENNGDWPNMDAKASLPEYVKSFALTVPTDSPGTGYLTVGDIVLSGRNGTIPSQVSNYQLNCDNTPSVVENASDPACPAVQTPPAQESMNGMYGADQSDGDSYACTYKGHPYSICPQGTGTCDDVNAKAPKQNGINSVGFDMTGYNSTRDDTNGLNAVIAAAAAPAMNKYVSLAPGIYCVTSPLKPVGEQTDKHGNITQYPSYIQGANKENASAGDSAGTDPSKDTIIMVPAATQWSNWCGLVCGGNIQNNQCMGYCDGQVSSDGKTCTDPPYNTGWGYLNGVPLICPSSPDSGFTGGNNGKFVFDFSGSQLVTISSLTVYGNMDTIYNTQEPWANQYSGQQPNINNLFTYYGWETYSKTVDPVDKKLWNRGFTPPYQPDVQTNCKSNPQWVTDTAGGIGMGDYALIQSVRADSMANHDYQDESNGAVIQDSIAAGKTCKDGIGGSGGTVGKTGNGQNFLSGARTGTFGCPGAHVFRHLWTHDYESGSSAMDIMDTVGVLLENSTNYSNNHVTLEGVRDSTIAFNVFASADNVEIHPDAEYVHNHYTQDSNGTELGAETIPSEIVIASNVFRGGGQIKVDFAPSLIPVPWLNVFGSSGAGTNNTNWGTNVPVAPWMNGAVQVFGNVVNDSFADAIRWSGGNLGNSGGGGLVYNNTIVNPVSYIKGDPTQCVNSNHNSWANTLCYNAMSKAHWGWKSSGISAYNVYNDDNLDVNVEANTIEVNNSYSHLNDSCEIQGSLSYPVSSNILSGANAKNCNWNSEGFDCDGTQVYEDQSNSYQLTCDAGGPTH